MWYNTVVLANNVISVKLAGLLYTGRPSNRPFLFAQNGRNQRRNEGFSQFGAENSQNGNFRRTQNGAEREAQPKSSAEVDLCPFLI